MASDATGGAAPAWSAAQTSRRTDPAGRRTHPLERSRSSEAALSPPPRAGYGRITLRGHERGTTMSAAMEPIADTSGAAADEPDIHTTAGKLADLYQRIDGAVHAGSEAAVERQHAKGRQTARERVDQLLDPGSFVELDALTRHRSTNFGMDATRPLGDGVVTGTGTIDGRPVAVFSQDATVFGGALGEVDGEKIVKVMDVATKIGCPVIGINDGGGARIQEGVVALGLYGEIFMRNVRSSGVVPQISLVMGPCAGGAVYSPAITDFTVMVDGTSHMFITGPDVIKTVTGEDVDFETLGGARTHNETSGNAHYLASDEEDAISFVQELLGYLPSNNLTDPPRITGEEETGSVPDGITETD